MRLNKVIVASDSFKGSVTSLEVADSVELAIHAFHPDCEVVKIAVADGGEGTVSAMLNAIGGEMVTCAVQNPLMRIIDASYAILAGGRRAVIDMASASGLTLISPSERNPWKTTTYGTGEMIMDALKRGCRDFLIGIGGSATNDAGCGMLQALGFRFLDAKGEELAFGGEILSMIHHIDTSNVPSIVREASFTVACDVDNPLYGDNGAAYIFAPQKGADMEMVKMLDMGLRNFATVVRENGFMAVDNLPGAGAAGGLGGGFVSLLNATLKPGSEVILDALEFEKSIQGADLIITGEGSIDRQTCMGKIPFGVLRYGVKHDIPVVAIAGRVADVELLNDNGFLAVLPIIPEPVSIERAMDSQYTSHNIQRTITQALRLLER